MMKGIVRLGLILAIFAVAACVALAVVYSMTSEKIDAQAALQLRESLKSLFPDAESFDDITASLSSPDENITIDEAYSVKKAGTIVGAAVKARGPSYGGDATVLIGLNADRTLAGARVLDIKDTPGLGANAVNPSYFVDKSAKKTFPGQFTGKALSDAFEVKKDVVAITASTITSRALTILIKTAANSASAWLDSSLAPGIAAPGMGTPGIAAPATTPGGK
jgi:electron transport complex protein RnfG